MSSRLGKLDMSKVNEKDENKVDQSSGRPLSHREIQQASNTLFKINTVDWNNVPKCVFEAIVALIKYNDNFQLQFQRY